MVIVKLILSAVNFYFVEKQRLDTFQVMVKILLDKDLENKLLDKITVMVRFALILSAAYWFVWAGIETLVLKEISFARAVFNPPVQSFWLRLPAVLFLVAIGAYIQFFNRRQKEFEVELDKSYDLATYLLDKIGSLVMAFDSTGKIVRFNRACERATGYTFAEVSGKYFWQLFLEEDDAANAKDDLFDLKRGQFPQDYEDHWICKDGSKRLIKWSNTVLSDKKGCGKYVLSVGVDITVHQQAEAVLRRTEEGYRNIIDNIGIGVSLVSPQREVLYMNRQMKRWFAGPDFPAGSVCHNIFSNFSKEPCAVCPTCRALSSREIQEDVLRTTFRGAPIVYKIVAFPIEKNEGEIIAVVETFEDCSRVDRQEEEILDNYRIQAAINSLLRFSLENISLDEFLKCALNIILSSPLFSSPGMGAIFLVEPESKVLSMSVQSRMPKVLQKEYARIPFGKGACGRAAASGDFQFDDGLGYSANKDRNIKPRAHYCSPVIYAGNVIGVIDICMEKGHKQGKREEEFLNTIAAALSGAIERKKDEQRLNQVKECLLSMGADSLDNIRRLVSLCGDILGAGSAFYIRINPDEDTYYPVGQHNPPPGYISEGRYSGSICADVIKSNKEEPFMVFDLQNSPYAEKDSFCSLYKFHTFAGTAVKCRSRHIGVLCGFYNNPPAFGSEDKKFLEIIASAIGVEEERINVNEELNQASAKLKEAQHGLVQSEKLAALGRFSSGVAHEVKNPLGIILGGIEYLESKLQTDDKEIRVALKKIKESTFRADNIVCSLVKFAMPSEIKTEKVAPQELINETLSLLKYRSSLVNVDITTDFADGDIIIDIDKNQIQQVLFNIFVNAIDAMPGGGAIRVRTYKSSGREFSKNGKVCVIEVVDTGEGIASENIPKLFEPFFTTKRERRGSGLGLAMSKTIVENNNGSLLVDSEVGKGTVVRVVLPVS